MVIMATGTWSACSIHTYHQPCPLTTYCQEMRLTYHHTPPDDAVVPLERDLGVGDVYHCLSCCISNNVSKVTSVPFRICWATMLLGCWIEMGTRTCTALVRE